MFRKGRVKETELQRPLLFSVPSSTAIASSLLPDRQKSRRFTDADFPERPAEESVIEIHRGRIQSGSEAARNGTVRSEAAANVRIGGKSWAANFETILSKVKADLGCEGVAVSAELYKLLVYDRDGFFLPRRDTEKTDGMFGTLVVTLPSAHRAGGSSRIGLR